MTGDGYGKTYDGNGAPVWHDHFFPATQAGEPPFENSSDFRFDVLEFANGKIAVWSVKTKRVVGYETSRVCAIREAMKRANEEYAKRDQGRS